MPKHETIKYSGTVGDIFVHRFVLITETGTILADLGPEFAEKINLKTGEKIEIEGEQKPSEVKVEKLIRDGKKEIKSKPKKKPHEARQEKHIDDNHDKYVDPSVALKAADAAGFEVLGEAVRHPKHFELRARNKKGKEIELHIDLDGAIRKEKPMEKA
jgi:hypothetical protein